MMFVAVPFRINSRIRETEIADRSTTLVAGAFARRLQTVCVVACGRPQIPDRNWRLPNRRSQSKRAAANRKARIAETHRPSPAPRAGRRSKARSARADGAAIAAPVLRRCNPMHRECRFLFLSHDDLCPYAGGSRRSAAKKVMRRFGRGNKMPQAISSGTTDDLKRDQRPCRDDTARRRIVMVEASIMGADISPRPDQVKIAACDRLRLWATTAPGQGDSRCRPSRHCRARETENGSLAPSPVRNQHVITLRRVASATSPS